MIKSSDKICSGIQNTHLYCFSENGEKYGRSGQATDNNMAHVISITN